MSIWSNLNTLYVMKTACFLQDMTCSCLSCYIKSCLNQKILIAFFSRYSHWCTEIPFPSQRNLQQNEQRSEKLSSISNHFLCALCKNATPITKKKYTEFAIYIIYIFTFFHLLKSAPNCILMLMALRKNHFKFMPFEI